MQTKQGAGKDTRESQNSFFWLINNGLCDGVNRSVNRRKRLVSWRLSTVGGHAQLIFVVDRWSISFCLRFSLIPHRTIVLDTMVAQMHYILKVGSFSPIHIRINLMQDYIELMELAKDLHFKVASPGSIDGDLLNIFVYTLTILHLSLIECLVLSQMLDNALSESRVNKLLAEKLVGNGSE